MEAKNKQSDQAWDALLRILKKRFETNMHRHKEWKWSDIKLKLEKNKPKLWSLNQMEITGGEPDVTGFYKQTGEYIFTDCSAQSPKGRRSLCYDREALESRKQHKPQSSAVDVAAEMGIKILSEIEYRQMQELGEFDTTTSSWIETPADIRERGGALFADYRYGHTFIYHNGAESYYSARGFRGSLRV